MRARNREISIFNLSMLDKVYVNLFEDKGAREVVTAQGRVFHRDGSNAFRRVRLTNKGDHALVATIAVGADGSVTVH